MALTAFRFASPERSAPDARQDLLASWNLDDSADDSADD
jgi:hypothetical protein